MTDALTLARSGDAKSFEALVSPLRKELEAHCYRMTGSLADAEDLVQESLVRAWNGLSAFEARASLRTWLYRVCTNVCLTARASSKTRELPTDLGGPAQPDAPLPAARADEDFVDPCPEPLWRATPMGPESRLSAKQSVTLAFLAAIQHLPPLQRAVLLLREVLGFSAEETAGVLETTVPAANSALQRARATLEANRARLEQGVALDPEETGVRALLERYVAAWESGDTRALTTLLKEDALLTMPPVPAWFSGRDQVVAFLTGFLPRMGELRLRVVSASGGAALAAWVRPPGAATFQPGGLHVLSGSAAGLTRLDVLLNPALFPRFGLPATPP